MSLNKYMPRPQKRRGNNGSNSQFIIKDSKQNKTSFSRGQSIGKKFLKLNIYNKKMNPSEITMNLYTHKLNEIPGILDEIIRCVVIDAPNLKRICFETGYGKPKKSIDIRKCASHFLTQKLGYIPNRGGSPKTFKFLKDHANRIVIFPQTYAEYAQEQSEKMEAEQAIIDAKNAKKERKAAKFRQKHFVKNKWKKNLKYPAAKKKRQPLLYYDENGDIIPQNEGEIMDSRFVTPGGDDHENIVESGDEDSLDGTHSSSNEIEETESTFLRNFTNLQVVMQDSKDNLKRNNGAKVKRSWNRNKRKKDIDIFDGVKSNNSDRFEYVDPDAYRYAQKPELSLWDQRNNDGSNVLESMVVVDKNGNWECEFCSYKNDKSEEKCVMCFNQSFKKRYAEFMSVVNENNQRNKESGNNNNFCKHLKKKEEWTCNICTFINENEGEVCEMCGTESAEREQYFDAKFDNFGKGFFQDSKAKKEGNTKVGKEEKCEESEFKININYSSSKSAKSKKKNNAKKSKNVQVKIKKIKNKNKNKSELGGKGMNVINDGIAKINREYQAQIWRANQDRQKRIEMLKRNGAKPKRKPKPKPNNGLKKVVGFVPHSTNKNKKKNDGKNGQKKRGNANVQNRQNNKPKNRGNKKQMNGNNLKGQNMNNNNKVKLNGNGNGKNKQKSNDVWTPQSYGKINFEWIDKLVKMGFEYDKAFDSVSNTNSAGFNEALDYLMNNL